MTAVGPKLAIAAKGLLKSLVKYRAVRVVYRFLLPAKVRQDMLQKLADEATRETRFGPLPVHLQRSTEADRRATESILPTIDGINVFGHLRGEFGLGESARMYVGALIESGAPVALNDLAHDVPHAFGDISLGSDVRQGTPYSTNLLFVNPEYMHTAMEFIGADAWQDRKMIGCWFWELENVPEEWREGIEAVDAVMVASSFTEEAFRRVTDKPVFRVALPLMNLEASDASRGDFGLPEDAFVFLASFDFNSSIHRKNPFGAIAAFTSAFPRSRDDVRLVIKSSNGHRYPEQMSRLRDAAAMDPRILIRDQVLPIAHMRALQNCADAYVSLHRAEGFGLGLAESMAMGKPVIATAWSGNMDFTNAGNSCLVGFRLVSVREGEYPHGTGTRWADPDTGDAAVWMRRLVDEPGLAARIGRRAASEIRADLCPESAARAIVQGIRAISNPSEEHACPH